MIHHLGYSLALQAKYQSMSMYYLLTFSNTGYYDYFILVLFDIVEIVTVQININDINDNPPFFPEQQYDGRVEETAPKGKLVMNVRASDADINNNFQYSLPSGNDNQAFEITNTGDIVVFDTGRLDYETKKVGDQGAIYLL